MITARNTQNNYMQTSYVIRIMFRYHTGKHGQTLFYIKAQDHAHIAHCFSLHSRPHPSYVWPHVGKHGKFLIKNFKNNYPTNASLLARVAAGQGRYWFSSHIHRSETNHHSQRNVPDLIPWASSC